MIEIPELSFGVPAVDQTAPLVRKKLKLYLPQLLLKTSGQYEVRNSSGTLVVQRVVVSLERDHNARDVLLLLLM